jgi:hypothetical protein
MNILRAFLSGLPAKAILASGKDKKNPRLA